MRANSQLCTFFLGDLLLGVEVRAVQEVVRQQELTRVPLTRAPIRGLLNQEGIRFRTRSGRMRGLARLWDSL